MESQDRIKTIFWRRLFSALTDLLFIYCTGFLAHLLVMQWIFLDPFFFFALSWITYYALCNLLFNGRTLAKAITGLQVVSMDNDRIAPRQIVIREVVSKFIILLLLPYYIIHRVHFYQKSDIWTTFAVLLVAVITMLVLFFIYKRPWWELASSTKTVKCREGRRLIRLTSFLAIAGIFVLTDFIKISYCLQDQQRFGTRNIPEFPVNDETRRYAEFIKTHSQDPVEYVFGLFSKYDLVVLDERMHPETTQYELFSKIISDPRFAAKIGNIYTELISRSYQDSLNRYLNTVFPNEDSLNMVTARLVVNSNPLWPIWGNTNLFDFLKFMNRLNTHSPDNLRINWYCNDLPADWPRMTYIKYHTNLPRREKRDQSMAVNIASIYRDKISRHEKNIKGLLILNHWHGFGRIHDRNGNKTGHFFNTLCTTAMLMDQFPGKVCNVLINTVPFGQFSTIFGPCQYGKWDKAFDIAGNRDAGFDFENSPFGDDNFDDFLWNSSSELKYKDVFTGFIFYKPLEKHIKKIGFPYMFYNFKDTLLRRESCLGESYVQGMKEFISIMDGKTDSHGIVYAIFYNIIVNIGFTLIIALTLVICLVFYFVSMKRTKLATGFIQQVTH